MLLTTVRKKKKFTVYLTALVTELKSGKDKNKTNQLFIGYRVCLSF